MGISFGRQLSILRAQRDLTTAQLADSSIEERLVALLESGAREPSSEEIRLLAHRLQRVPVHARRAGESEVAPELESVLAELGVAAAWDARDYSHGRALAAAIARSAREKGHEASWWNMMFLKARCLFKQGSIDESLLIAQDLLGHPIIGAGAGYAVRARQFLSELCLELGRLDAALAHAREAERSGSLLDAGSEIRLATQRSLIEALAACGKVDDAWKQCSELTALAAEHPADLRLAGEVEWVLGMVAFRREGYEAGSRYHRRAAMLLTSDEDVELWGQFRLASANALLDLGRADAEAHESIVAAERSVVAIQGSLRARVKVSLARARWLFLTGAVEAAARELCELDRSARSMDGWLFGEVSLLHGRVLGDLGDLPTALSRLAEARNAFERVGAWHRVSESMEAAAQARLAQRSSAVARPSAELLDSRLA